MTEGGTAAQVPQEIARLARSHEEVSILFMDIVGETIIVSHPCTAGGNPSLQSSPI